MRPLNLARVRRLAARAVLGRRSLESLAGRHWVICQGETSRVPPALHPSGSVERIHGFSPWVQPADALKSLRGERLDHAATVGFEVSGIEVVRGHIYKGPCEQRVGWGKPGWILGKDAEAERIDSAWLVSTRGGCHFFGMWARADLPTAQLPPAGERQLVMANAGYRHESGYRHLLGLPASAGAEWARIDSLMFFRDFGENRSKESRYRTLRARLRQHMRRLSSTCGVYLRRGGGGEPREITNEALLESLLCSLGFAVVDPDALGAQEIAEKLLDARLVISCEGSHLAHSIYSMADDATLLVIQPPHRFSLAFKAFTDRLGMRFGFVVGRPSHGGFEVDLGELASFINRIESRAPGR